MINGTYGRKPSWDEETILRCPVGMYISGEGNNRRSFTGREDGTFGGQRESGKEVPIIPVRSLRTAIVRNQVFGPFYPPDPEREPGHLRHCLWQQADPQRAGRRQWEEGKDNGMGRAIPDRSAVLRNLALCCSSRQQLIFVIRRQWNLIGISDACALSGIVIPDRGFVPPGKIYEVLRSLHLWSHAV